MPRRDLRADILDAAERLALERGFSGITTREVAEAAECSEGSIYNHFRDRTDLLAHVVAVRMLASTEKVAAASTPDGDDPLPALSQVIAVVADAYLELIGLSASLIADPAVRERFNEVLAEAGTSPDAMRAALATRVAAGQQRGDIRPDVEPDAIAMLIVAACHQAALHAFVAGHRTHAHATSIADDISSLLTTLLAPPPGPRRRRHQGTRTSALRR